MRAAGRALLLATALAVSASGAARAAEESGWSYRLENELMSPYCPGRTLVDCPSAQAGELRQWIVEQERLGRDRSEVEEQLYEQYGDVILQAPKARGFGLAAYVIPVVLFFAGGALLFLFLRRQTREAEPVLHTAPRIADPELERLVDEELRRDAGMEPR